MAMYLGPYGAGRRAASAEYYKRWSEAVQRARRLSDEGMSVKDISLEMGVSEASARILLAQSFGRPARKGK